MQLRTRSSFGPRVASAAPLEMDLHPQRAYRRGECVALFAEAPDLCDEIRAAVVDVIDSRLRVRVLKDVFSRVGERVVQRGDEFVVATSNVFSVHFSA